MSPTKNIGLGRGLDSLIPKDFDQSILDSPNEKVRSIKLEQLEPNPKQPRTHFDQEALQELSQSIIQHGIVQPLVVTPEQNNRYMIIAGERRYRAAKLAGLEAVPAIVRSAKELEQLEIALVENVQRVDLSPLEQAVSIKRLNDQFNMDIKAISKKLGKAESTLANIVRLLNLPPKAQEALIKRQITEGHARAILALKDAKKQQELLDLIVKNNWTVRQAENFVTASKQGAKDSKQAQQKVQATTAETKALGKKLKTQVSLKRMAKGGKIEIAYKSDQDLWRITNKILGS